MTVEELIKELQCYEGNKKVFIKMDGNYTELNGVEMEELLNDEDIVLL